MVIDISVKAIVIHIQIFWVVIVIAIRITVDIHLVIVNGVVNDIGIIIANVLAILIANIVVIDTIVVILNSVISDIGVIIDIPVLIAKVW